MRRRRRGIKPEDYVAEIERDIPLGRIGTTEELARAIVFLGSDLSSYISGVSFPVDGGLSGRSELFLPARASAHR